MRVKRTTEEKFEPIEVVLETEDEVKQLLTAIKDYNHPYLFLRPSQFYSDLIDRITRLEPTLG